MPLEKAYIEVLAGSAAGQRINVLFNPAEYSLERANAYKSTAVPGLGSPLIQFVNGDAATLSMELFLDDMTDPDGRPTVCSRHRPRREEERQGPHRRDHGAPRHRPRTARAAAGALRVGAAPLRCRAGEGRAQGVAVQAGRHAGAREPLGRLHASTGRCRARRRRSGSKSADKTKRRQISASESIWLIADKEYGDPRRWRLIARGERRRRSARAASRRLAARPAAGGRRWS